VKGPSGLEVTGRPPECLAAIRRELEAAQEADAGTDADVDHIFEIPLRVARQLVGFKRDEDYQGRVDGFEVLEAGSAPAAKKGLLSRLFTR
jgi:hypothetical protein